MYHVGGDQLEAIKRLDLRFVVGGADICFQANHDFCHVLYQKGIWYELDVWSPNVVHDWHEWRRMILKHLP
jgi:esterase/lipase superfamily enzyme